MSEVMERTAQNVVTSENLAEFTAKRLGLAEAPEPTEAAQEPVEQVAQSEPAETGEQAAENEATQQGERKQNPKLEKRFSEITKQREEARAEAQREREARQALEARLKEFESQATPTKAETSDDKPRPEQFNDAYQYAEALAEWSAEKAVEKREKQELERKAQEAHQATMQSWAKRVESAKAEMPDFDDMVGSADVAIPDYVRDSIIESDVGPKILYHLAENREFAQSLATMPAVKALREIGKLEARFEKNEPPASEKPAVKASKAPAPISPIAASAPAGANPGVGADGQFHGTYQQWREARKAGKIR